MGGNQESANFILEIKELAQMTLKQAGEYIKLMRVSKRLNQIQLAELAGVKQSVVSTAENGNKVGGEAMDKITEALGIEIPLTHPRR